MDMQITFRNLPDETIRQNFNSSVGKFLLQVNEKGIVSEGPLMVWQHILLTAVGVSVASSPPLSM